MSFAHRIDTLPEPTANNKTTTLTQIMGSRALVAFQRDDGNFDIHYSHWGAYQLELEEKIQKNEPLGGDNPAPEFLTQLTQTLSETADEEDLSISGHLTEAQSPTAIQRDADIRNVHKNDLGQVVDEHPDAIEALYVVTREFDVTGFMNKPLSIGNTRHGSLLIRPKWFGNEPSGLGSIKGRIQGMESTFTELIQDDIITNQDAHERLINNILSRFHQSLRKYILPQSTAVPENLYDTYIGAFFTMGSSSKIPPGGSIRSDETLNRAVPSSLGDYQLWRLPSDFPNPEAYAGSPEKLNPEQFKNGKFIGSTEQTSNTTTATPRQKQTSITGYQE